MPGLEDMLTNIRTTGQGVPMGGPPPGGPPPGGPPMGPPPVDMGTPMGSPPVGDPMMALMGNENMLGGDVERGGEMSIENDAIALADAVVGRAEGDIEAAVAILDEAKYVLLEGGPPVDPMMANMGGSLTRKGDNNSVGKYAGGGEMKYQDALDALASLRRS